MTRPLRIEFAGAFYHVTSRGDDKKEIYKSNRDRERFLEYLLSATERYGAVVHVYCLMTNHYHLLLETPHGNLSQIMRHINGAYTIYYNVKRKRAGHLFQGRFKAILIEADEYALELSRYIHLNPVRAGIVKEPENYIWSSYSAYIGRVKSPLWLDMDFILGLLKTDSLRSHDGYQHFVDDLNEKEYTSPLNNTVASSILGRPKFVEQIMGDYLDNETSRRDVPAVKGLNHRFSIEHITDRTREVFPNPTLARNVAIHLCHLYTGATLSEIGSHFGISDSGVSKVSMRLKMQLKITPELSKEVESIQSLLYRGNVQT